MTEHAFHRSRTQLTQSRVKALAAHSFCNSLLRSYSTLTMVASDNRQLLGVQRGASHEEIRRGYSKLVGNYLRIAELLKTRVVKGKFVMRLEREQMSHPIIRRTPKLHPMDQVDRVRVARLLIEPMGVNLEAAEVALHMREQMIAMERQFNEILRMLGRELKRQEKRSERSTGLGPFQIES